MNFELRKIYYSIPCLRRMHAPETNLVMVFKAYDRDMQRLRTIYKALRRSGMSELQSRWHTYEAVRGFGRMVSYEKI